LIGSYLTGSLPFGFWIGLAHGKDIRQIGSGNVGATNVIRILGWGPGLLVFVLDVLKGAVPSYFAAQWQSSNPLFAGISPLDFGLICGVVAVVGHMLSPFLAFRGGKGVATGLGALLGVAPIVGISGFLGFLVVLGLTRYVSLGSIAGALTVMVAAVFTGQSPLLLTIFGLLCIYIVYRHVPNMKRLKEGTEPKIGQKVTAPEPEHD